jgi:DNA polymerase III epsilon subunit family exonuclease
MNYVDNIVHKLKSKPLEVNQFNEILYKNDTFFTSIDLEKELILSNGLPLFFSSNEVCLKTATTFLKDQVFCIVDIETTAGNAKDGQIIEIAAIKVKNGIILDAYESLVTANSIPRKVQEITNINVKMLEDAPNLKDVLEEFKIFLEDDVFVAHNISFDYKFISDSLKQNDLGELFNRKLCTIDLAKRTIKAKRYGLKYLKEEFNIEINNHHRAYFDALSTVEIFKLSLDNLPSNIQFTEELIDFSTKGKQMNISKEELEFQENINTLINTTMEALIVFDNNSCVDINTKALELFNYDKKSDSFETKILDIFSCDSITQELQNLIKSNVDIELELAMSKKNSEIFSAKIQIRNIVLKKKKLKILTVMDLTLINEKEKLFKEQSKLAAMGEMIGNIAHQWRQPLSSISIAASNIKVNYELDMVDENELFDELDSIVHSTVFLSDTINDFQSFIKGDSIASNFYISDTIQKVLKLVDGNIKAADINVILNTNNSIKLYNFANELVQVFLNIINNAKDALVQNNIENKLLLINTSYNETNTAAIITIQDNANGIPENIIEKIFEPYFTTKEKTNGTGLGLYMTSQMLTEHLNGKISVCNKEFEYDNTNYNGALFTIELAL